jgi:hypothetical protein
MPDLRIKPYNSQTWYTLRDVPSISCNWEINRAGMLTASVPFPQVRELLATIRNNGYPNVQTLAGMVCEFTDPAAGAWGGKVMQFGGTDGMAEISAMSYEILLRKTLVPIDTSDNAFGNADGRGHPGKVMLKVLNYYNGRGEGDPDAVDPRLKIEIGTPFVFADGGTIDVGIKGRLDAYDDILPMVTDDVGFEFNVDANRVATFAQDLGTVKTSGSNAVTLVEGTHISAASWQDDSTNIVNSIRGSWIQRSTVGKGKKSKTISIRRFGGRQDDASVAQFGVLRERRDYGVMKSNNAFNNQMRNEIDQLKYLEPLITVEVPNVDNIWARFTHGDTVNLQLGNTGYSGTFRVMVRSLDAVRGVMVCSGYGAKRTG